MRRTSVVLAVVAGLAAIGGAVAFQIETTSPPPADAAATAAPDGAPAAAEPVVRKAVPPPVPPVPELTDAAVTPMRDRVAVIGLLNKRSGVTRDLTLKPGQSVRVGDVIVRLRACDATAPWESQKLTGAFVQADVRNRDGAWHRIFSGWLYKESPSLNVVEHPIYDVWPKSCAMRYPDIGPDTVPAGSVGGSRSSAKKSDAASGEGAPAETPNAASSNPT